jgi:hypothetical protein
MITHFFLLIFALVGSLFLGACAPIAPSVDPLSTLNHQPVSTSTGSPLPASAASQLITTEPILTPSPAASPAPILSSQGPWLAYAPSRYAYFQYDRLLREIILVDSDGSAATPLEIIRLDDLSEIELVDPGNRLFSLNGSLYLLRPNFFQVIHLKENWPYRDNRAYTITGSEGLFAHLQYSDVSGLPELFVHKLPGFETLSVLPLLHCSEKCETRPYLENTFWINFTWSPSGRFLAYTAVIDSSSTDLYLYDSKTHVMKLLSSEANHIGSIWWSPQEKWIVFEETPDPSFPYAEAVWAISMEEGEARRLYSPRQPFPQGILEWLDEERFLSHDGYLAVEDGFSDLRLVNLLSGEVESIFPGAFYEAEIDPRSGVLFIMVQGDFGCQTSPWLRLSLNQTAPECIEHNLSEVHWDSGAEFFVSDAGCLDGETGSLSFSPSGEPHCKPRWPEHYASPDKRWEVVIEQTGISLHPKGKEAAGRIHPAPSGQVIWRLDSEGFFLEVEEVLYYISAPAMTIQVVDKNLQVSPLPYQWIK